MTTLADGTAPRPHPADGYTDLAPGKLAAVVTYLEMREAPSPCAPPPGWRLERFFDLTRYRRLYAEIGDPWLWTSRRVMGDPELAAILSDPRVEAFAVVGDGRDIGLVELDFRDADPELAFFGLVPDCTGRGLGRGVMEAALEQAWSRPIRRLFLHTCTLDHPGAIRFYQGCGFVAYKRAIEVMDDPRLTGQVPRESGPHIPIIGEPADPPPSP